MVNRNLLRMYDLPDTELQQELDAAFRDDSTGEFIDIAQAVVSERQVFEVNKIVTGRVANIVGDDVVVDIGYKSEGIIPLQEWYDESVDKVVPPTIGEEIQVLLDAVEDESGAIVLSYRKAKRQKEWEIIISRYKEGDSVAGMVTRKIKGGLLVNIGVNVFLPASQGTSAGRPTSRISSTARSSARSSRSTRPAATSSSRGGNCSRISVPR
jgi:small subunit ribosomal protein S1